MNLSKMKLKDMSPELMLHELRLFGGEKLYEAAIFAAYYHRNDTRGPRGAFPRDMYINHCYRVALRLVRWGVRDIDIIMAAVLHDVYEDHRDDIAADFGVEALQHIEATFGARVAALVYAVSNPPGKLTPEQYHEHVIELMQLPQAFVIKLSDWTDNALSLQHTPGPRRGRLARKYMPLAVPFRARLHDRDVRYLLSEEGATRAIQALDAGVPRLREFSQED